MGAKETFMWVRIFWRASAKPAEFVFSSKRVTFADVEKFASVAAETSGCKHVEYWRADRPRNVYKRYAVETRGNQNV